MPLVNYFIEQLSLEREPPKLDNAVANYLFTRKYPGNVRELKQTVTRIVGRHVGPGPITVGILSKQTGLSPATLC